MPPSNVAWPSSWSIVSSQYWPGTTFASTRTSPSRSMSMQKACWHLSSRGKRSLRSRTGRVSSPIPVKVRSRECHRVTVGEHRPEIDAPLDRDLLEERVGVVPGSELRHRAAETGTRAPRRARASNARTARPSQRRPRRGSRRASTRPSPRGPARARTSRDSRRRARRSFRSRASSRTSSATVAPTVFDASQASRRSAPSSLSRRMSRISLLFTRRPATTPRCVEKTLSTAASSSMIRVRRSAGT